MCKARLLKGNIPSPKNFEDVSHGLLVDEPAIVEKDYFMVNLLALLSSVKTDTHNIVFAGGSSLVKSDVATNRMSEDIDFKLVTNDVFEKLPSSNAKRNARRSTRKLIEKTINESELFNIIGSPIVRDESRFFNFSVAYPNQYTIPKSLRAELKVDFIETDLLSAPEIRAISSFYAKFGKQKPEVGSIACTSINDTMAEKIVSMLRRTASYQRNSERADDPALVRHIYDVHCILESKLYSLEKLAPAVATVIQFDIDRYGNQHAEMVQDRIKELGFGLTLLQSDPKHESRYQRYVLPVVFSRNKPTWETVYNSFSTVAQSLLNQLAKSELTTSVNKFRDERLSAILKRLNDTPQLQYGPADSIRCKALVEQYFATCKDPLAAVDAIVNIISQNDTLRNDSGLIDTVRRYSPVNNQLELDN